MKKVVKIMEQNERGATLVYVLLLILVFSVLGMALMGNAVSETKQTEMTESELQAQHLALNGLTYFETAFRANIEKTDSLSTTDFLKQYQDWVPVGDASNPDEVQIKAKLHLVDEKNIEVWSKGTVGNTEKIFKGYYRLDYEMQVEPGGPPDKIPVINGGIATSVDTFKVLGLGLGPILNLGLIQSHGKDSKFYRVPDDEVVSVALLNLIGISIGDGKRFKTMEETPVILTRESTILNLALLGNKKNALINVNLLPYKDVEDTNVLINGGFTAISLLGIEYNKYQDIDFKQFAVMGNCLIQQDRDGTGLLSSKDDKDRRRFTFKNGLYVSRSLVIGGAQDKTGNAKNLSDYSKLMLRGDMVIMENLVITDVDLQMGDIAENELGLTKEDYFTGMYVQGDAEIKNACINMKNANYGYGLLAKGKVTIENNANCNIFPGLYYAEGGIEIKTNGKPMIIKGGLIGDVKVDDPDMLTVIEDPDLLSKVKITNISLTPQGRAIENKNVGN